MYIVCLCRECLSEGSHLPFRADSDKLQAERAEWRKELAEKEAQLQQEIKAREERLQAVRL